jgi:methionine synthase II (cobalamin-independent)
MPRLPAFQTTMIGSMPHASAEDALKTLSRYPLSIPSWPQLPKRSFLEGMVPQCSEGLPGIQVDHDSKRLWLANDEDLGYAMAGFYEHVITEDLDALAISESYAAGLHCFLQQLKAGSASLPRVKGQITGPFTMGLGLNDQEKRPVWFDEQYRDVILKGLSLKARWLVRELSQYADSVLVFLDEPILSALGTPAYVSIQNEHVIAGLNEVIHAVQEAGALVGIHCCGNMDWGLLASTDLDIIAFDAYFYGDKLGLYAEQIESFLQRDGILAYGLVPTLEPDILAQTTAGDLQQKLTTLLDLFIGKAISEDRLRQQMLLTPSCGMGTLSTGESERVLELLSEVAHATCLG